MRNTQLDLNSLNFIPIFCSEFQIKIDQLAEHELPERNKFRQTNVQFFHSIFFYILYRIRFLFFIHIPILILWHVWLDLVYSSVRWWYTVQEIEKLFRVQWQWIIIIINLMFVGRRCFFFLFFFLIGRSLSRILINNSYLRFISFEFIYHVGKCCSHYYINLLEFRWAC